MKAKGTTFDGRDIFRALFNIGETARKTPPKHAGIDLAVDIDTVLGFSDTTMRAVKLTSRTRAEKFTSLDLYGLLEGGKSTRL